MDSQLTPARFEEIEKTLDEYAEKHNGRPMDWVFAFINIDGTVDGELKATSQKIKQIIAETGIPADDLFLWGQEAVERSRNALEESLYNDGLD